MVNPLKVATAGYLKRQTKAVLIIAVAGYLNFQGAPIPTNDYADGRKTHHQKNKERIDKIKRDDEEILSIIKMFLENAE